MNLSDLIPSRGERAIIMGQTGSGKTKLAEYILRARRFVVALDSKGTLAFPGYTLVRKFDQLHKCKGERIIFRPGFQELQDEEVIDSFFEWIYRRRHTTVYVDELLAISRGTEKYPAYYGGCITRGRELGVEVWTSTQRPNSIPQVTLSESEHAYVFKLKLPQDRQRAADVAGVSIEEVEALRKKEFFWAPQDSHVRGPYMLDLAVSSPAA